MKLQDLERELKNLNINNEFYSLSGGFPNEAYCINKNEFEWEVYYSERGQKSDPKIFNDENSACNYFFGLIISDPLVRR